MTYSREEFERDSKGQTGDDLREKNRRTVTPTCGECGALLRYEYTANSLEHWRCPTCGNPHWWLVPKEQP